MHRIMEKTIQADADWRPWYFSDDEEIGLGVYRFGRDDEDSGGDDLSGYLEYRIVRRVELPNGKYVLNATLPGVYALPVLTPGLYEKQLARFCQRGKPS